MPDDETPITLWSALVVRGALDTLLPRFSRASGLDVAASFDPTTVLVRRLASEPPPDVVVVTSAALLESPLIDVTSIRELVGTGIGVGVAAGTPPPSVATVPDLVETLLGARSVAYSRSGQSGIFFAALLHRLGIAERVNARATVIEKGFTGEAVVDGRADIAIQQVSELRFVPGVAVAGPLPDEVQHYTDFGVALTTSARHPAAPALRDFLVSAAADEVYRGEGLSVPAVRRQL